MSSSSLMQLLKSGRKIVAVGKNYALHIKEMGGKAPKDPVLFLKPTTSYVFEGSPVILPKAAGEIHHEVELALLINKLAKKVPVQSALDHVGGYALALDLTARDLQWEARENGLPWSVAKGWDGFCPISNVVPKSAVADPDNLDLWLKINGQVKQQSNTKHMINKTAFLVSYISSIFTLEPGDVILTGTPEGVGPIKPGDVLTGALGKDVVTFKFTAQAE